MNDVKTLVDCSSQATSGVCRGSAPQSVLDEKHPTGRIKAVPDAAGFTIILSVNLGEVKAHEMLLEIPGAVEVWVRDEPGSGENQNYGNFRCADGSCPVLEARVFLHSEEHPDWKEMTVGVPLSRLATRGETQEVALRFTGARWWMGVGELEDEDFPFGKVVWQPDAEWALKSPRVKKASLWTPPLVASPGIDSRPIRRVQYFTPEGHNAWVGDVAVEFHDGRFHVFYLMDRRHHRSKFGCGGHYFAHLSSPDLINWFEHPPAVDIDEQWQTCGTGTPFIYEGRLHLAYGIHTTRICPREKTLLPAMDAYLQRHRRTGVFRRSEHDGIPAGATYAVSEDGIHFRKSQVFIHPTENPTVYGLPDGTLRLYGGYGVKGEWAAASLPGEFLCVDADFPPQSVMDPCTDCPCVFEWNGRQYLIQGFTGFWSRPVGQDGAYVDLAAQGRDIYDGLGVPMVAACPGNRRVLAGWLGGLGWGGHLVLRELVQLDDGTVGLRWLPEVVPPTGPAHRVTQEALPTGGDISFDAPGTGSVLLNIKVEPDKTAGSGVFAVRLLGADGEVGCELQIDAARRRAQWNDAASQGFAASVPSAPEIMAAKRAGEAWAKAGRGHGNVHASGRNFCIEQVGGMDRPFTLKVMVFFDRKINGSVVDAEIAGQRTLVSCRPGLSTRRIVVASAPDSGIAVPEVTWSPLDL